MELSNEMTTKELELARMYLKPKNYEEYKEGLAWFTNKVGEAITEEFNKNLLEVRYVGNTK
jgi:hypothetical protein